MPHLARSKRTTAGLTALLILAATLLLAACGGSSGASGTTSTARTTASASGTPSSTSATQSSTTGVPSSTSTSPSTKGASPSAPEVTHRSPRIAARLAALRTCLAKNGVELPTRGSGRLGLLSSGDRAKYREALKKCGQYVVPGRGKAFSSSPKAKLALIRFAACMRENGVNLPAPNTSGKGPIFNVSGLNVASSMFKAAEAKCAVDLRSRFRRGPHPAGTPGAPGSAP